MGATLRQASTSATGQLLVKETKFTPRVCVLVSSVEDLHPRETWLWKNTSARLSVVRGGKELEQGQMVDRGSFARYADIEID
jgi:hypothetical protein